MPIIDKIKQGSKYVVYLTLVTGASIQTIKLLQKEDGTIDLPTTLPLPESTVVQTVDVKPVEVLPAKLPPAPTIEEIQEIVKQSLTEEPSSMDAYFEAHKNDAPVPPHIEKTPEVVVDNVKEQIKDIIREVQPEPEIKVEVKPNIEVKVNSEVKPVYKKVKQMIDHHKKHHKSKKYCVVIKYQPDTGVGDMIRNKLLNSN